MRRIFLGSILFCSLSTMACTVISNPVGTPGELGNATFEYTLCVLDCGLDHAMMHGTEESIGATAKTMPAVTVTSTAPGVVTVINATPTRTCCSSSAMGSSCRSIQATESCNANETTGIAIDAIAAAPGSAEIVLTAGDGTVFDRIAVGVADPASLEFSTYSSGLSIGTSYGAAWTARDESGAKLMSTSGVHLVTSDASVVDFKRTLLSSNSSSVDAEDVLFGTTYEPHAHGNATITATAQGVTTSFQLHVN